MGADLKNISTFDRRSLLVMDDSVVILDHRRYNQDRVRRVPYDALSEVAVYKQIPWLPIIAIGVVMALPAVIMFMHFREGGRLHEPGFYAALAIGILLTLLIIRLLMIRRTTLLFRTFSGEHKMSVICTRGKIDKVLGRMFPLIEQCQNAARAASLARAGTSDVVALPPPETHDRSGMQ